MAVVVTGAAGFIARHVVARLQAAGHRVIGIDRRGWQPRADEQRVLGDLAEPDAVLDEVLRRATGVVHLAARPGVRDRTPGIETLRHRDNILAGARVLDLVPDAVPVVVASSSSVYGGAGPPDDPRACHEDDQMAPRGGYAESKFVLEGLCRDRAERGGRVSVVRPFTVAGEGQRPDMALSLWTAAVSRGQPVAVFGDPGRRRDVTDVHDVADGVVRLLEADEVTTVNLGTGDTHRLDELVAAVGRALGTTPRKRVVPVDSVEVAATRADTTRCRDLLGFVPTTDLDELVSRQVAATPGLVDTPTASRHPTAGVDSDVATTPVAGPAGTHPSPTKPVPTPSTGSCDRDAVAPVSREA